MKKTYLIHQWEDGSYFEDLLEVVKQNQVSQIIYIGASEFELPSASDKVVTDLENALVQNNIQLHLISGCEYDSKFYYESKALPRKNTTVHFFPGYWLYAAYMNLLYRSNKSTILKNFQTPPDYKFDKLFVSLNNLAHEHRVLTMDQLARYDLIKSGYISWLNRDNYDVHFDFWKEEKLVLDLPEVEGMGMYDSQPEQYFQTPINLVVESNPAVNFLTEKTFLAIMARKIPLVISSQGINRALERLGFRLYYELFDYTFDNHSDLNTRINLAVKELKKLEGQDLNEIYNRCKDTIEYNVQVYKHILENRKHIPGIIDYVNTLDRNQIIGNDSYILNNNPD